jgi:CD109 antigen
LQLKDQPEGFYNLEVKSLTGDFQKIRQLDMNMKKQTVLVQTDKAMYKPADKVQFRVIVLNADMLPIDVSNVQIFISDGAQNRVKQFDDVKLTKGVFQGELQLSDLPVLGNWEIKVKLGIGKKTTKQFEVAEYTLPKFEVKIDANPDANFKDGKIRATVRANYSFGKIAKGNATVTAEVEISYRPWRLWGCRNERSVKVKVIKTIEVDGKKSVEFDMDKELKIRDKTSEYSVKLTATFIEELTRREQNATAEVQIHVTPHKIELKKSSDRIKPGLPYSVTAIVQHHDKNAPVTDKSNPVKFTVKYYYDKMMPCKDQQVEPLLNPGVRPVTGQSRKPVECLQKQSYEETKELFSVNGIAKLDVDLPLNIIQIDVEAKYLETVASIFEILKSPSENNRYLQISTLGDTLKLSENIKVRVLASENLKELTYQVEAKGNVIVSEVLKVSEQKSFDFDIKPSLEMLPKANLIVFYITLGGEIVSDSQELEFGNELRNQVRKASRKLYFMKAHDLTFQIDISLSKEQVKPGENVEITISTKPNSLVGLLGVDQSVLVLKSGNDIEQSTVFEELDKYNDVDEFNDDDDDENDMFLDFHSSNLVVVSNTKRISGELNRKQQATTE